MNGLEAGKPKDSSEINSLARSLAALKMDGMRVRSPTGPSESTAVTAVFETWEGLLVSVFTRFG